MNSGGLQQYFGNKADLYCYIFRSTYISMLKGKVLLFLHLLKDSHSQKLEHVNSHNTAPSCTRLKVRKLPRWYAQDGIFKLLITKWLLQWDSSENMEPSFYHFFQQCKLVLGNNSRNWKQTPERCFFSLDALIEDDQKQ